MGGREIERVDRRGNGERERKREAEKTKGKERHRHRSRKTRQNEKRSDITNKKRPSDVEKKKGRPPPV